MYMKNCILFSPAEKHLTHHLIIFKFLSSCFYKRLCVKEGSVVCCEILNYIYFNEHNVEGAGIVKSSIMKSNFSCLSG